MTGSNINIILTNYFLGRRIVDFSVFKEDVETLKKLFEQTIELKINETIYLKVQTSFNLNYYVRNMNDEDVKWLLHLDRSAFPAQAKSFFKNEINLYTLPNGHYGDRGEKFINFNARLEEV